MVQQKQPDVITYGVRRKHIFERVERSKCAIWEKPTSIL